MELEPASAGRPAYRR